MDTVKKIEKITSEFSFVDNVKLADISDRLEQISKMISSLIKKLK